MATALNIIKKALRKAMILSRGDSLSASEAQDSLESLNQLLGSWSNNSSLIFDKSEDTYVIPSGTSSITIGAGGDINAVRPVKIVDAFVRIADTDYNLDIIDVSTYEAISDKTTGGIPYGLSYIPKYPLGEIRLYPVPASGYTLHIISEKPLPQYPSLNSVVDLPAGWERALVNNLAVDLCGEYGQQPSQSLLQMANNSYRSIKLGVNKTNYISYDGDNKVNYSYSFSRGF